ncbi:hypothetical protein HAX54_013819 [Datura stramonium]|uniref:Uncharacterized protein n=1 Tax=Datura stramonium TaxID=4076 RepID=A0ABS8TNS0_DATST|nr:hypothetical protein [Datura stramonium]
MERERSLGGAWWLVRPLEKAAQWLFRARQLMLKWRERVVLLFGGGTVECGGVCWSVFWFTIGAAALVCRDDEGVGKKGKEEGMADGVASPENGVWKEKRGVGGVFLKLWRLCGGFRPTMAVGESEKRE